MDFIIQNFNEFLTFTGFANASAGNLIMILVGALFIWLAIKKDFEPLLLVPIGLGIILGNIPFRADAGLEIGLYEVPYVLRKWYLIRMIQHMIIRRLIKLRTYSS